MNIVHKAKCNRAEDVKMTKRCSRLASARLESEDGARSTDTSGRSTRLRVGGWCWALGDGANNGVASPCVETEKKLNGDGWKMRNKKKSINK